MYVLVVAISGGDVVATSVVAKSAPSLGRNSQGVAVVGDSVKIVPASLAVLGATSKLTFTS